MTLVGRIWLLLGVCLAGGGAGYLLGYWHGTPKFLKCLKDGARLRGCCPHCRREYRL